MPYFGGLSFSDSYINFFRRFLPRPFTIALGLTFIVFVIAFFFTGPPADNRSQFISLIELWYDGLWMKGYLAFTVQMMLILVLGHALALSDPVDRMIGASLKVVKSGPGAAALVAFLTMIVAFYNWGLGLIFGAVLARRVGAHSLENKIPINYPLIAAAGYSGLMVWHGGLSGSAPLTVAGSEHALAASMGVIPTSETVFSQLNLVVSLALLVVVPVGLFLLARKVKGSLIPHHLLSDRSNLDLEDSEKIGAERIEAGPILGRLAGLVILAVASYMIFIRNGEFSLDLNNTNLTLLGLGLIMHSSIKNYLSAIDEATKGASGIPLQFPLYFGILGILQGSGMMDLIADKVIGLANSDTLPVLTFFSAGLVNIFVPSGGGQWAVQGPIIAETARQLNVPLGKMIMAFSYGDQWTNMLQPFWALPLLAITGLRAKDILPYTLYIMLLGGIVFLLALLV